MNKYGNLISEKKHFPEDEPIFVLRGKDILAPAAVEAYANLLRAASSGVYGGADGEQSGDEWAAELNGMAQQVSNVAAEMIAWQASHPARVKLPD